MLTPCENIIKKFLPAMKSSVTKELAEKYDFTQTNIASTLGLTQAAVSKYLSGRYSKSIKDMEKSGKLREMAQKIAFSIAREKANKPKVINLMCTSCVQFTGIECNLPELERMIESMLR